MHVVSITTTRAAYEIKCHSSRSKTTPSMWGNRIFLVVHFVSHDLFLFDQNHSEEMENLVKISLLDVLVTVLCYGIAQNVVAVCLLRLKHTVKKWQQQQPNISWTWWVCVCVLDGLGVQVVTAQTRSNHSDCIYCTIVHSTDTVLCGVNGLSTLWICSHSQ